MAATPAIRSTRPPGLARNPDVCELPLNEIRKLTSTTVLLAGYSIASSGLRAARK